MDTPLARRSLERQHEPIDIPLDTLAYSNSNVELPHIESDLVFDSEHPTQSLAPTDGGRQAWSFLIAATLIEIIVWGLPFSVGVLHEYWINDMFAGQGQEGTLTTAATLQSGLMYIAAIVQGPLLHAFPHRRNYFLIFGLVGGAAGFFGSAFVTEPWHLIITLGIIYPISGFLYLPAVTLLFEWFVIKRGLATGIMFSGTGIGGFVFPFVMKALIERFGYKVGMCCVAAAFAIVGGISVPFIVPRIPVRKPGPRDRSHPRSSLFSTISRTLRGRGAIKLDFLQRSTFYAFIGNNVLISMANFLPAVYIPSYAHDLGMTKPDGTVLLAVMNASSIPGLLLLGYLSDKISLRLVISLSCFGTALSCIFLWGFATSTGVLIAFVVMFGILGLSYSAIWTNLITMIAQDDPSLPPLLFPIFAFSRGIGNVSSGPVSTALLKYDSMRGSVGAYGKGHYGPLLVYTGIMMTMGGICGIVYRTRS